MKKKHLAILISAVALVAVGTIGATLARGSAELKGNNETISEYALSVAAAPDKDSKEIGAVTPGENIVAKYAVVNDQKGDAYDVYVRATVYHSFESDNEKVSPAMAHLIVKDGEEAIELPTDIKSYDEQDTTTLKDWIIAYSDEEQVVMYYKYPVKQGEETSHFLDEISFDPQMDNTYTDCKYQYDVEINAVQVNAGEAAIASELGVFVTLDEDGNIVKVAEEK